MVAGESRGLPFVYASLLPAEEAPLHHVCPGGLVFRVVVPGSPWGCGKCRWSMYTSVEGLVVRRLTPGMLRSLAVSRPQVLLLDGPEPLAAVPPEEAGALLEGARRASGGSVEYGVFSTMGLAGPEAVRGAAAAGFRGVLVEYPVLEQPPSLSTVAETVDTAYRVLDTVELLVGYDGSREARVKIHGLASRYPEAGIHVAPLPGAEDAAYRLVEELRDRRRVNAYLYRDESYTLTDTSCTSCGEVLVERKPWGVTVRAEQSPGGYALCPRCRSRQRLLLCSTTRRLSVHRELVVL